MKTTGWIHRAIAALAFCAAAKAQTYNVLVNLDTDDDGSYASLIQDSSGNFYGTTPQGKTYGTIYKMDSKGNLTILHIFDGTDGTAPQAGMVLGSDGNFYGTTYQGGTNQDGTVYQLTPAGTLTSLYSFAGTDGKNPYGKLVQATDGNFYGVTFSGGSRGFGTVFRITTTGTLTTIHQFAGTDGANPRDGLIQASDGNLYGTTSSGGASQQGTVFRLNLAGILTTLHSFSGPEGSSPYAALVQGSSGSLYGTTWQGGSNGDGTIFSVTTTGKLTTLYSFAGTDGKNPNSAMIQGADGNFYGVTYSGGDGIYGTIFAITPGGTLTRLHSFGGQDGQSPQAPLFQTSSGLIYGTANLGGANGSGVIFTLSWNAPPSISAGGVVPVYSGAGTIQPGEWVSIYGSGLASGTATWNGNFPTSLGNTTVTIDGKPAYLWFVSPGQINLQAPDDTTLGSVPVVVTNAGGSATSTVTLGQFGPSFSLLDSKHVAGLIFRSDGSGAYGNGSYDIIGPTGTSLGYQTVAATGGDTIALFGVGFGPTNPAVPSGKAFNESAPTVNPVSVTIGNATVTPSFAGLSAAGVYQLNLVVPTGQGAGDVPLQATVGNAQTPSTVVISLQ